MHEGFVDADYLEGMARQVEAKWTRAQIDGVAQALVAAGLLRDIGQATYEMHPVLTGYLRSIFLRNTSVESRDSWARAFVDVMGTLADQLTPLELHQQRIPFHLHGANFYFALTEAERLGMATAFAALTQSLAAFAQNTRSYATAASLFERLAKHREHLNDLEGAAAAYHQLGMIAEKQRDFAAAEQWYRKSLAIEEKRARSTAPPARITTGDDRPGATGFRRGGAVVSQVAGDQGEAGQ